MATHAETRALPYGMGHFNIGWLVAIVALFALFALGLVAYSRQITEGEIVTSMRDVGPMGGAPWGLYIAFELYAVGVGFGAMLLLGVIRIGGFAHLRPLSRTLGLITLVSLVIGYLSVIADVGQPLRAMINIARYARPMSPFSGTFTIGLILSLSLTWVYFYLESRKDAAIFARRATAWSGWLRFIAAGYGSSPGAEARHRRSSLALAAIILAVGVAAASSSGFVFGMQVARPGWFGALQAPGFVTLAAVTATGVLLIIAAVLRKVLAEGDRLDMRVFGWLSNLLTGLTLAYIYFLPAELITAGYGARLAESRITEEMLTDHYAWMFWLSGASFVAAFAIGGTQALRRRHSLPLILVAAVLVNVAAMIKRCLIVVPSLTHGNLLPYPTGSYGPTWVEYSVIVGLVALAALLYVLFMKVFPIMDVQEEN